MGTYPGWSKKTLRELATINYGKSPAAILSEDGAYPVVGTGGVERNGTDYLHDGESIVLGRKGSIERVYFTTGKFWTIDTAYYLSNFIETVPAWLYYFLQTLDLRQLNEATGVPSLSRNVLYGIEVLTPSKSMQTKIAKVLSKVDQAIDQTKILILKQQRIKIGLMRNLLTRGIDEHGTVRSEQTHKFKNSSLGRIPMEWGVKKIEELLSEVDPPMRSGPFGSSLLKEELCESGIPLLGIDNVFPEKFVSNYRRFVSARKAKQLKRFVVRPQDIIITIMGTVGQCCIVPDDIGEVLSSKHIWTISLDKELYSPYLACIQINYAPWVTSHFAKDMQGGIMTSIRSETLRTTYLPVPPIDEMQEIENRLRAISNDIDTLQIFHRKLLSQKTSIMQDLLTGR